MADWRNQGFVADSDDEDAGDSQTLQPQIPSTAEEGGEGEADDGAGDGRTQNSLSQRRVEFLEDEDELGSTDPRYQIGATDILPVSSKATFEEHGYGLPTSSNPSSCLSSPPSDLPSSPPSFDTREEEAVDPTQCNKIITESLLGVLIPQRQMQPSTRDDQRLQESPPSSNAPRQTFYHSLRKRNPIQLHPYLLESERYRQTLHARGLKPLRITLAEEAANAALTADTQDQEYNTDEDTQLPQYGEVSSSFSSQVSVRMASKPVSDGGPSPRDPHEARSDTIEGGIADFPDVDVLLSRQLNGWQPRGFKRQRTRQISTQEGTTQLAIVPVGAPPADRTGHLTRVDPDDHLGTPDSIRILTQQRDNSVKLSAVGFRVPRGVSLSETSVPRPVEIHSPNRRSPLPSEDYRSDDEVSTRTTSTILSTTRYSSPESESETVEIDIAQVDAVRRKIKGVLPASWLKLDQQDQLPKSVPKRSRVSLPDHQIFRPGIARKPSRSSQSRPSTFSRPPNSADELDDRTRDQEHVLAVKSLPSYPRPQVYPPSTQPVLEDNRIDAMLPTTHRSQTRPRISSGSKRQTQQTGKNGINTRHRVVSAAFHHNKERGTYQSGIDGGLETVRRKPASKRNQLKRHNPHLGIFSIPDRVPNSGNEQTPLFIRIAKRRARTVANKGRDSPTHKVLRLATRTETEEVQKVLRAWRSGDLRPAAPTPKLLASAPPRRPPLSDLSINTCGARTGDGTARLSEEALGQPKIVSASSPRRLDAPRRVCRVGVTPLGGSHQEAASIPNSRGTGPKAHSTGIRARTAPKQGLSAVRVRSAQLESTVTRYREVHDRLRFHQHLAYADRLYDQQRARTAGKNTVQISRFLADDDPAMSVSPGANDDSRTTQRSADHVAVADSESRIRGRPQRRRARKRPPRQIAVDTLEYRQPSSRETIALKEIDDFISNFNLPPLGLHGVGSFGATYIPAQGIDFGTNLDGGSFSKSFNPDSRDDPRNWDLPRQHAMRLFDIYQSNPGRHPPTFNAYCRALFSRCHFLIKSWGWSRCDAIIGSLFDFFAANNLAHLRHEEVYGTPGFLARLDEEPDLEVGPSDRCFHILLKIIGIGIQAMRTVLPEKHVRNVIFRLIPNHGRQYPKEESVRQADLEALRNHHDLLCTLYWASPPSCRPSINTIRNLVHIESSHREACHISLKAWTNLVRFQLSVEEPLNALETFSDWHSDLTRQLLQQRDHARTEAQAQYTSMASCAGSTISIKLLEATISQNQLQVDAVLRHALSAMADLLKSARSRAVKVLLHKVSSTSIFALFDPKVPGTYKLIASALEIIRRSVSALGRPLELATPQPESVDSQGFEDCSAFKEFAEYGTDTETVRHIYDTVHEGLVQVLSNAFGADIRPPDELLMGIIDTWIAVIGQMVRFGIKQWGDYLEAHHRESWGSLRNTHQSRQYSCYFLSKCIAEDVQSYRAHKWIFVSTWVASLVEPRSMLAFQNLLTSTLLDADGHDPLFRNVHFRSSTGGHIVTEITKTEFSNQRLALVACVLANMRTAVEEAEVLSASDASRLRCEYVPLLKQLMSSMKARFRETRHDNGEQSAAYVTFVHGVVESLQQYSTDLVAIDRFFTDGAEFPLPAGDPSYVVGRLRNYAVRLSSANARNYKQLISYLQSISERAALEDQQDLLTRQIQAAVSATVEDGDPDKASLRRFLAQVILPVYVGVAFDSATGWILARPMLAATRLVLEDLMLDVDASTDASLEAGLAILTSNLSALHQPIKLLMYSPSMLSDAHILSMLTLSYEAISASLPALDYLYRTSTVIFPFSSSSAASGKQALRHLSFFHTFSSFANQALNNTTDMLPPPDMLPPRDNTPTLPDTTPTPPPNDYSSFKEARTFATSELSQAMRADWVKHGSRYFFSRGKLGREISMSASPLQSPSIERDRLQERLHEFDRLLGHFDLPLENDTSAPIGKRDTSDLLDRLNAREGWAFELAL